MTSINPIFCLCLIPVIPQDDICRKITALSSIKYVSSLQLRNVPCTKSATKALNLSAQAGQSITFYLVNLYVLFGIKPNKSGELGFINTADSRISIRSDELLESKILTTEGTSASLMLDDKSGMYCIGFQGMAYFRYPYPILI